LKPGLKFPKALFLKVIILTLLSFLSLQQAGTASRYIYHKVKRGETLYRIAKSYGVSVKEIMRANGIKDPKKVRAGKVLAIPQKRKRNSNKKATHHKAVRRGYSHRSKVGEFVFPGKVLSMKPGVNHGLDLKLAGGIVRAAGDGKVIYRTTSMLGYSSVMIIQHQGGFETVYAGTKVEWSKEKGQWVMQGEIVGTVNSGFPLHFEIRRKGKPIPALRYIKR
jgi:murein DD-endopeptidase MepM/ murein hydrolase activator NlpD